MGIGNEVIGFARGCFEKIQKEKGPNFFSELRRDIGEEVKNMTGMGKDDEKKQLEQDNSKDIDER